MFSKEEILREASIQGYAVDSFAPGVITKFIACVLIGILTKPLPKAVADCASKLLI